MNSLFREFDCKALETMWTLLFGGPSHPGKFVSCSDTEDCHICLYNMPTLGWFWGSMYAYYIYIYVHMAYMECLGWDLPLLVLT